MSIACPRCHEQVDGVPDGCRDPNCPTFEIQQMELQRYNSLMAAGRAESAANMAYSAAKDAVIAAARDLRLAWSRRDDEPERPLEDGISVVPNYFTEAMEWSCVAIAALDAMERAS